MSLVPFELEDDIVVQISQKEIGGVLFDAEAHVEVLSIEPGAKQVVLYLDIHYKGSDGEHVQVDGKTLAFKRKSIADMSFFVDVATGVPIIPVDQEFIPNPEPQEEGDEEYESQILNPLLEGKDYLHEWRFFRQMMHVPVVIYDLIVAKIQYADSIGKFN